MVENLTNAALISQIAKNNPVWDDEKSRELLRLNRKFTYYRNVNNLMQTIYRQNKIHTLNSDDYAVEISNKFNINKKNGNEFFVEQTNIDSKMFLATSISLQQDS